MRRWLRSGAGLVLGVLLIGACTSPTSQEPAIEDETTSSVIQWLPCGDIECGQVSIDVDSEALDLGAVKVALYRRTSPRSNKAPTLIMVADRRFGYSPRVLAEQAKLYFGANVDGYNIVSVAVRGTIDSPMPAGSETRIATLDVVEDLEAIREALNVEDVFAMGWGSGATAVTTWKMQYPQSIKAAVVDAPMNPAQALEPQIMTQLDSSQATAVKLVKWCASHLSCDLNADVADEISRFKLKMLSGTAPPAITRAVVARAAANALALSQPNKIFTAIAETLNGDASRFLALAGPELTITDAYAPCADVSQATATRISRRAAAMHTEKTRQFPIGTEPSMYALCSQLPASPRPLGAVQFFSAAKGDKVMVTIARGDPIVPPAVAREMAQSMKWTFASVYANRHLVLGFDQAVTDAAMEFLAS